MILKTIIWLLVASGLLAAALVAALGGLLSFGNAGLPPRYSNTSGDPELHDSYFYVGVGDTKIEVYPRRWAVILIGVGIVMIIVGLVAVLHIPLPRFRGYLG